jgi:uncharacterized protein (TIRG00374 family)
MFSQSSSGQARTRERLQVLLGTLVSLIFLWLTFRKVDWRGTWQTIEHANIWLLAMALLTVILTTLIRAERWRLMFYPDHRRLRVHKFVSIFLVGQVINAVIPIRLGELARAYLVGEIEHVSKAQALWTTVLDKVLDSVTLLLFLLVLSFVVRLPQWLQQAGWMLSVGLVIVVVILVLGTLYQEASLRLIGGLEKRHPWIARAHVGHLVRAVFTSLRLARTPALALGLGGWSFAAFLMAAATNWIIALALGIRLPLSASLLLLVVLQISAVVPIPTSPGRVGLFHYLCVITLAIFGLQRDVALAYGLVLHVLTYLPMAVGGPICLWLENYDWRGLSHLLREDAGQNNRSAPSI